MLRKLENITNKILRQTEKWTKTDMVYLVKNGFWLTLGQFFASLSTLILSMVFAYFLTPELYGTYKYILAIIGILATLNLTGMGTSVVKSISQNFEGSFFIAFKEKIMWGFIGMGIGMVMGIYYIYNENSLLGIPLFIGALFLPIMDSLNIYLAILQAKHDFKTSTKFIVSSQIFSTIAILAILLITKNIYALIFTYFASWTLARLICFKKTLGIYKLNSLIDPDTIPYGKHLSLMSVLPSITGYLDRLLLFHFIGPTGLAIYSIAIAPVEQIKAPLKNIYILALPKFSKQNKKEIDSSIKTKIPKLLLLLIFIIILYVICAPFLFKLLFPKYAASIIFSQIYSISLIGITSLLPYTSLEATTSTKKLYYFNLFSSLTQIVILFALTPIYGIMGVIIARIASRFFNVWLAMYLNKN